jgi:Ca2+-binding RTX toxin-like protein
MQNDNIDISVKPSHIFASVFVLTYGRSVRVAPFFDLVLVFNPAFAKDTITDFIATGATHDVLQFDHTVFASYAQVMAAATQSGSDIIITKDANAWIKNQAEEAKFVDALKKGAKLIVKAASLRGHVTTDSYSLTGLAQALERVAKECP